MRINAFERYVNNKKTRKKNEQHGDTAENRSRSYKFH